VPLTTLTQISSLLEQNPARGWETREWAQTGMNLSRKLKTVDSASSRWLYLFFLSKNLSERVSLPALLGRGVLLFHFLFFRLGFSPGFRLSSQLPYCRNLAEFYHFFSGLTLPTKP